MRPVRTDRGAEPIGRSRGQASLRLLQLATGSILIASLAGCAYVTKSEYDSYWDADGDEYGIDEDCEPNNADVYPGAGDVRGDGCDADCGFELDTDGDDWPDDVDCDPDNDSIYPCAPDTVGDGVDSDCADGDAPRTDACDTRDPYVPDAKADVCGGKA